MYQKVIFNVDMQFVSILNNKFIIPNIIVHPFQTQTKVLEIKC